jgi:hypothetical protein
VRYGPGQKQKKNERQTAILRLKYHPFYKWHQ